MYTLARLLQCACWRCVCPTLAVHCSSVAVALSATGTDMTFAWNQLEGVTYQCSINGQPAEDCESSATLESSLPPLHVVWTSLHSPPSTPSFLGSPGFTVPGTSLSQTGNVLIITLFMDGQPVGQQSFSEPVAVCVCACVGVGVGVHVLVGVWVGVWVCV